MNKTKNRKFKKLFSALLASVMVATTPLSGFASASAVTQNVGAVTQSTSTGVANSAAKDSNVANSAASSSVDYGLADNPADGTILHCFDWKLNDIKAELPNIAAAGFTSVQTSPLQKPDNGDVWYDVYRPRNFQLDGGQLGTKQDLIDLCNEADKYGIKVIVDVVANHTNSYSDLGDSNYHHNGDAWYTDRRGVTFGKIGMPDLATESSYVQGLVKAYVAELKACGVDGIRWDAAKHIAVPSEGDDFWKNVPDQSMYNYGEILAQPCDGYSQDQNNAIMKEYTTYISATDANYGGDLRWRFGSDKNLSSLGDGFWTKNGISANKLVYWAESHDTYSNCEEPIFSQNSIDRAYAIAAARSDATALYFSRPLGIDESYPPKSSDSDKNAFKKTIKIAKKGSTHFTSPEVAAVNHFHNALVGQSDVFAKDGSAAIVAREGGAVIALISGSNKEISVTNPEGKVKNGTYTDEITGKTFTVANGKISGVIGSSGIAVIYDYKKTPSASLSKNGGSFYETEEITVTLKNATNGTIQVGSAAAVSFTGSKTITIGENMEIGESVVVKVTATDGTQNYSNSVTFKKIEKVVYTARCVKPSGWSTPLYAYVYNEAGAKNAKWPGEQMTYDSESGAYKYTFSGIEDPIVIFTDETNQYPEMNATTKLTFSAKSMIFENKTWKEYKEPVKEPSVKVSQEGGSFTDSLKLTFTLENATSGTYKVGSEAAKTFTTSATATIGADMAINDSVEVTVTATNETGSYNKTYTFKKVEKQAYTVYFKNTSKWSKVYAYMWSSSSKNATWPGEQMTLVDSDKKIYKYEFSKEYKNVIFNNGSGTQTDNLTYPGTGYLYDYSTGKWSKYEEETPKPEITASVADGSSFKTETKKITLTLKNATKGTYSVDNGPVKEFTDNIEVVIGQGKIADSTVTVAITAVGNDGTVVEKTFKYTKEFNGTVDETKDAANANAGNGAATAASTASGAANKLDAQYKTNPTLGAKKTITVDGDISDWDSSMLIAQGAANDDPRVYCNWAMHENPVDLYALYACYDENNLYLMWEMTNVQDVVAPNDDYPLSQGVLYQTGKFPVFVAIDTRDSATRIGNDCKLTGSEKDTLWASGITFKENVNKVLAISTNGENGPYIYGGDATGLNPVQEYSKKDSGVKLTYGMGILSTSVNGIKAVSSQQGRVPGDVASGTAKYVDFNTLGHKSSKLDFHYEMSIPLEKLGTSLSQVEKNGLGVMMISTFGTSGMDSLPYDLSMSDNAAKPYSVDPSSSNEKEDCDEVTATFASVAKLADGDSPDIPETLELNFGADRSAPQMAGTELTLKGIAQGGEAGYTYEIYVDNTKLASKNGVASWTATAGQHMIKCVCTDAKGNVATSIKRYNVEGDVVILKGWQKVDGNWYYYDSKGNLVTGWKAIDGKWYYLDPATGIMLTKWQKIDGKWYYFNNSGDMVIGWKKIGNKWYSFMSSGEMRTGWYQDKGVWYYLDPTGGYMVTSKWISGKYYVKENGQMAVSEWVDNGKYYVGADGKWVPDAVK